MTWNLWGRFGPWQARQEAIAATMAEVQPDVCGLQEVWSAGGRNLAEELAGRLGLQWRWAHAATANRAGQEQTIGNAILSRWPIAADAQLPLPVMDGDESRVALHARIDTPGGALPMFTTHFTHWLGGSQIRVAQARRLAEFVAEHADGCPCPPVVTGDLNAEPDSDELRLLGGILTAPAVPRQVLVDAWRHADPPGPGYSWDRHNPYHTTNDIPDTRIDYILVGLARQGRGEVRSTRLAGTALVDGVLPSDHYAVVADLD
jgi:endonuclease/exonuclease/phosphatase family metal-dependent hydrolase